MAKSEMPSPVGIESHSEVSIPKAEVKQKGIEVVALRSGFYKGSRRVEGDKFTVPSLDKVGTWMKCLDEKLEVEHQKLIKDKKKALAEL